MINNYEIRASDFSWPPRLNSPQLTLLGPVYEAEIEKNTTSFSTLERAFALLAHQPENYLPQTYLKALEGIQRYSFRMGYRNDEEWGTIKNGANRDPLTLASVLENNPSRDPGLELAARLRSRLDSENLVLEGYRLILQPGGQAFADWFEINMPSSVQAEALARELARLLVKPLWQLFQFTLIEQGAQLPLLPVLPDAEMDTIFIQQCIQVDNCPSWMFPGSSMKGRVFFKKHTAMLFTSQKDAATQVCEALGLEMISEKAIILVQQMKSYGFESVTRNVHLHGVYVKENSNSIRVEKKSYGGLGTVSHDSWNALERFQKLYPDADPATTLREVEILKAHGSLIWCQLSGEHRPRQALDIYSPDRVGIIPGVAILHQRFDMELKGKSNKTIRLSYPLNGFRIQLTAFPSYKFFAYENMKGSGTLLKPSTPFYLVSGTQLYNVHGTSANLERFIYSPRKKHGWFYELGWESVKIQLHTSKGNLNSLRRGPFVEGGYDFRRWLPNWFQQRSSFLELRTRLALFDGPVLSIGYGLVLGATVPRAFRPIESLMEQF